MNQLTLPVTPATLPSGACPGTNQELLNLFSQYQSVIFPDTFDGVIVSATKPSDTSRAWLKLDSLGRPVRFYTFASGAWLALHPCVPGFTMIWTTAVPTLTTFDGGDAQAVSDTTGPMWEVVMAGTFPLGAGTLASGAIVAPGDVGGEEKHVLLSTEMPAHRHVPTDNAVANQVGGTPLRMLYTGPGLVGPTGDQTGVAGGLPDGTTAGHNNLPPYTGITFLRRTARAFYAA